MRTALITLLVGLFAALTAAPAMAQNRSSGPTVTVQNDFNEPIEVFLERGRFDRRLGTVDALETDTLPLPAWLGREDPIELFVVRKNGEEMDTQSFTVWPGERIGMIVPPPPPVKHPMRAVIPPEEVSKTTLTVENHRPRDVVVFAEEGPFQVRLGTVKADSTSTLEFPAGVVGPDNSITVLVQPRGEFALESHSLMLRPGEHLGLRLDPLRTARRRGRG